MRFLILPHERGKHAAAARRASDQQPAAGAQQPAGNPSGGTQQ